jgi:Family of unknown function (DUF5343)
MALPKAYLTSTKNLSSMLNAIKTAQAPEKFTHKFLASLEFSSSNDRLIIGVLKGLGFLADDGKPTQRYYDFLDQTQSGRVLADGIKDAYGDLFAVNVNAHKMTKDEVVNKLKTLGQGQISDSVLEKMALTFTSLVKLADFQTPTLAPKKPPEENKQIADQEHHEKPHEIEVARNVRLGGLVYNIQIVLPESRDSAVYDVLFRSLKEHIL